MPFLILVACMGGAYWWTKRAQTVPAQMAMAGDVSVQSPGASSTAQTVSVAPPSTVQPPPKSITILASATPQIPDSASKRQGSTVQTFFPQGFTSQRSPVTQASPKGATVAPGIKRGGATLGGSLFEKGVYTEVGVPMTPVGAYTAKPIVRAPVQPPKVTSVIGGTGATAPKIAKPIPQRSTPLTRATKHVARVQRTR